MSFSALDLERAALGPVELDTKILFSELFTFWQLAAPGDVSSQSDPRLLLTLGILLASCWLFRSQHMLAAPGPAQCRSVHASSAQSVGVVALARRLLLLLGRVLVRQTRLSPSLARLSSVVGSVSVSDSQKQTGQKEKVRGVVQKNQLQ